MNTAIAAVAVRPAVKANRPGSLERAMCVLMVFFLSFNTPNRWFLSVSVAQELAVAATTDPFAVALLLGFAFYFGLKLAGNWQPLVWVAMQDRLFVAFFAMIGLSTLWSVEPIATFRENVVTAMVVFFALYLVVRFSLRDMLFFTCTAVAVGLVLDYIWIVALPQYGDTPVGWSGTHLNKNSLGRIHVLSAIVFLVGSRTFRRFRVVNYLFGALAIGLVIGSTSSTSLVSLLLALLTTAVAQAFRARKSLFGAVVLSTILSAVAAVGFATANLGPITDLLGKDVTFTGRTPLWDFALHETLRRPWTGFGWNAYWNGFLSPAHEVWIDFPWKPPHAHNAFIDYALQLGWPAVALFLAMIFRAGYRSVVYVRDTPGPTGLLPLSIVVFSILFSLSEAGVVGRNSFFLLLTFAIYTAAVSRVGQGLESVSPQLNASRNNDSGPTP